MTEPVFRAQDIGFSYSRSTVFSTVDFSITGNQILFLLGPNGSGKSTLLKILGRILSVQAGRVLFRGRNIMDYSSQELAHRIAYVPQDFAAAFDYSVHELVMTGRYPYSPGMRPLSRQDHRLVREAISLWNLSGVAEKSVREISGGERRLAVIASAMVQECPVLLLDEPTANLDLHHVALFVENVKKLKREDRLIIVVSHDINLASLLAQRIMVLGEHGLLFYDVSENILRADILQQAYKTPIRREKGLFYIQ